MRNFILVFVIAVATLLTGCATRYAPPNDVSSAQITLSTSMEASSAGYVLVQAFQDEDCNAHKYGTRMATFTTLVRGDPHEGVDRRIEVGRDMVITFSYNYGISGISATASCNVTTAFTPEESTKYSAHFRYLGKTCELSIIKIDQNHRPLPDPVKNIRRLERSCFNSTTG